MGIGPDNVSGGRSGWGRGRVLRMLALGAALAVMACPAALAGGLRPNPANDARLLNKPIEDERYDDADGCRDRVPPGTKALQRWLERNVSGESWGISRCERLKSDFSVHSEGRAIDWHLDAGITKERRAANRLIDTLLDSDRDHNVHALARRMGVQGLIFDCRAWWIGMEGMGEYSYCYRRDGELRHGLDRTQAHRDHVHIELNWPGARKRTSFWRSPLAR